MASRANERKQRSAGIDLTTSARTEGSDLRANDVDLCEHLWRRSRQLCAQVHVLGRHLYWWKYCCKEHSADEGTRVSGSISRQRTHATAARIHSRKDRAKRRCRIAWRCALRLLAEGFRQRAVGVKSRRWTRNTMRLLADALCSRSV